MNKKLLIALVVILGICTLGYIFTSTGILKLETAGSEEDVKKTIISVEDLEDNKYYVWHNDEAKNISSDLKGTVNSDVFKVCPSGDINWSKDSFISHTIWFTSANDSQIPTLYQGDELLYISSTYVPTEGISWERFADYGYTIGVANMVGDKSGHYYIVNSGSKKGYAGYVYTASDTNALNEFQTVSNLFLDKIGSVKVRDNFISDGGTILGLEKDKKYVCEWYTGTYYQDFEMKANIHTFGSLESFMTYDYEFLHSNCIAITIPDWLKTGYYYLDNIGFFRYIASTDAKKYNGKPYDSNIDWNDPIILYNEDGSVKYNPSITDMDSGSKNDNSSDQKRNNTNSAGSENDDLKETSENPSANSNSPQDDGDAGAEEYEDIYNEIVYD